MKTNVLIYEKNEEFREKIKNIIESFKNGFVIFESDNILDVIRSINKDDIDIFIVDFDLCKEDKYVEEYSDLVKPKNTIIMTNSLTEEESKKMVELNIFEVLYRPIDNNQLRVSIHTLARLVKNTRTREHENNILISSINKQIKFLEEKSNNILCKVDFENGRK